MSHANCDCEPNIDWSRYFYYEKMRKKGFRPKNLQLDFKVKDHVKLYEEIFQNYLNEMFYGNA